MSTHGADGPADHSSAASAHHRAEHTGREFTGSYWEQRYHDGNSASEPEANAHVVAELSALSPGTALDAGCGEGAVSIWLAERGWQVTAVDIAATAVSRGRERAIRAGTEIAARIDWHAADLTQWDAGVERFDLVCACYVHPVDSNDALFDRLAAAVAPGGTLFIVGHAPGDHHSAAHSDSAHVHVTAAEIAAGLDPQHWDIRRTETRTRSAIRPDGASITMQDSVFRAQRR
ncbi:class I SAM-dependent methyltransferase [Nocardia sp. NPDC052254]|uniref:class I SAM-dependent methyltransferase n=1 Tax=Nocardia sp. NPDC052254 TaxID=3155681 RepID=UPI003431567A